MALGSGSTTVAITSIASSLLIDSLRSKQILRFVHPAQAASYELRGVSNRVPACSSLIAYRLTASLRQNQRPISRHGHAMLKMRAGTAIGGYSGPLGIKHLPFRPSWIHPVL